MWCRALLLALFAPCLAHADVQGKVVGVSDGDTITVLDVERHQHKVRLAGIDAPEKHQPFGQVSKRALSDCAYGHDAVIRGHKLDRYGRLIGKVIVQGQDCNLQQIRQGLAWHYKKYQNEQSKDDALTYAEAEEEARGKRLGLWQDPKPTPPWDFRHEKREAK